MGRLVKRLLPYQNDCIIKVIQDLYFTGGSMSFASQFDHLFPKHHGDDGKIRCEVPIPMVALVATAVGHMLLFCYCTDLAS